MLTKLLAMNACAQIDYSGVGSKADAWHIAHFLKFEKDRVTLRAFKSMKDFQEFIDTIEKCFCAIAIEDRNDRAVFRDIFYPTRENLYDAARKTKLDDLSMDWMAYELAMIFSQWAQLYTDTQYATMEFEAFKLFRQYGLAKRVQARRPDDNADPARQPAVQGNTHLVASQRLQAWTWSRSGNRNARSETPGSKRQKTMPRLQAPAAVPPGPPKGAKTPAKPAARGQAMCLWHLLHNQDPAQFPDGCQPPCLRNHNVQLHAGKLALQEKADALASLGNMKVGIFPTAATKYIVAHL